MEENRRTCDGCWFLISSPPTSPSPSSICSSSVHSPLTSYILLILVITIRSVLLHCLKMMTYVLSPAFKRKHTDRISAFWDLNKPCAQTKTLCLKARKCVFSTPMVTAAKVENLRGRKHERPQRGQATCPRLNGKVGSWSLGELCWKRAQGQLSCSWQARGHTSNVCQDHNMRESLK